MSSDPSVIQPVTHPVRPPSLPPLDSRTFTYTLEFSQTEEDGKVSEKGDFFPIDTVSDYAH